MDLRSAWLVGDSGLGRPTSGARCKRLLANIGHGLIDVVVVYKVDRLTRALVSACYLSQLVPPVTKHGK